MANRLAGIVKEYETELLGEWLKEQLSASGTRKELMKESELREQSREFLSLFRTAVQFENRTNIHGPEWERVRELLRELSDSRARQGFTPAETATFVLSLKRPLFNRLRKDIGNGDEFFEELNALGSLIDKLGLYTGEVFQRSREEVISRQQNDMLELSTPVVKLWEGILALPMIGTLDSARTQVVMETLLQRIVETGATVAIIDITGVPTVDTLVAQHLMKTVAAARLMGADCIISGIRPSIAQTIVHLAVDLGQIVTKATLKDAFALALRQSGLRVVEETSHPRAASYEPRLSV